MATFDFNGKEIYYEEYGQGDPIVVLNGIMMSCPSWYAFIDSLSANNRLILFDMLDQGKSAKMEGEYSFEIQADVLLALLDHLRIEKANLTGVSYGGIVSLRFAISYPERVKKMVLFDTTEYLGQWLADIGVAWMEASDDAKQYYYTSIPVIYSPEFYKNNMDWMNKRYGTLLNVFSNKAFIDSMNRLTISMAKADMRDEIKNITAPTLIVSGREDYLIPMSEQERLVKGIPGAHWVIIPNSGHCSMYEQPEVYAAQIIGFINDPVDKYMITA